jgi:hypothetical protein
LPDRHSRRPATPLRPALFFSPLGAVYGSVLSFDISIFSRDALHVQAVQLPIIGGLIETQKPVLVATPSNKKGAFDPSAPLAFDSSLDVLQACGLSPLSLKETGGRFLVAFTVKVASFDLPVIGIFSVDIIGKSLVEI